MYHLTTVTLERRPVFNDLYSARVLINTLRDEDHSGTTETLAFVVMPDHLHWLVQLKAGNISSIMQRVKSVSAVALKKKVWSEGFYDRGLRSEENVREVARYIIANPIRAGLVTGCAGYSHWDAVWI